MKGRGPRPRPDEDADFLARLRTTFRWLDDPTSDRLGADVTGWWRDPVVLAGLGPALGRLVRDARPDPAGRYRRPTPPSP